MSSDVIEVLNERDRPALVHMLDTATDFYGRIEFYRKRPAVPDVVLVARMDGQLVGMTNASYDANLAGMPHFERFKLPSRPHAFLDRVFVQESYRRMGVGRALVESSLDIARQKGSTFAGGHIDARSDPTERIEFFENLGFDIREFGQDLTVGVVL